LLDSLLQEYLIIFSDTENQNKFPGR